MSSFTPAYRMRVYEPRSADVNETTLMTPAAGAVHSDNFQVATMTGVSGYQPYMGLPNGRRGKLNPLRGKVDTGTLRILLQDQRTTAGGTNLERWGTAFLGNAAGEPQLLGLRAQLDESTDGGTTWATWYTGRISDVELDGRVILALTIRDARDDLKVKAFVGRPSSSVSYADSPQLLPLGPPVAFGTFAAAGTLSGEWFAGPPEALDFLYPWDGSVEYVGLDSDSIEDAGNIFTEAIESAGIGRRARCRLVDGGSSGEYWARATKTVRAGVPRVTGLILSELNSSDPDYLAFRTPAAAVTVQVFLHESAPTEDAPLTIGDAHPADLIQDILGGKFGYHYTQEDSDLGLIPTGKAVGDPWRTFSVNSASFTAESADDTYPLLRFTITKPWDVLKFIEEQICAITGLGYKINESGEFELLDLRVTSANVGSPATIDQDDIDTAAAVGYAATRDDAVNVVNVTFYEDLALATSDLPAADFGVVKIPATKFHGIKHERRVLLGQLDIGEKSYSIDAQGLRISPAEVDDNAATQGRTGAVLGIIDERVEDVRLPYASGVQRYTLSCRRTTPVNDCYPGDWRLVAVEVIPDPGTNKRGGTRLARCIERAEDGVRIRLSFEDAGPNTVLTAPTIGTLAAGTNVNHELNIPVTVNGDGDPVTVWAAVTTTAVGTRPVEGSPLWVRQLLVDGTATYTVGNMPNGMRIWIRARSVNQNADELKLPSAWAYSSGTDYRDMTALSAPTSLSVAPATILTASRVVLSWTNTAHSSGYVYAVSLTNDAVPLWVPNVPVVVPAGSTQLVLNPYLVESKTYSNTKARYVDQFGGLGTESSAAASYTTPAGFAGPTLTAPTLAIVT